MNAIEHVIIPRFANTIAYIVDELEELGKLSPVSSSHHCLEREDFYRLKKVKDNKQKEILKNDARRKAWQEVQDAKDLAEGNAPQTNNLLEGDSDSDDNLFG